MATRCRVSFPYASYSLRKSAAVEQKSYWTWRAQNFKNRQNGVRATENEDVSRSVTPRDQPSPEVLEKADVLFTEANEWHEQDEHEKAIEMYKEVLDIAPNAKEAFMNLGLCYYETNQFELAEKAYEGALKLDPTFTGALYNKGLLYDAMGKGEAALDTLKLAINIAQGKERFDHKEKALYLYSYAVVLDSLGRKWDAIKKYDEAIDLDPFDGDTWSNRGQVLSELGRHDEAIKSFKEALECTDRKDPTAWYNVALSYIVLGDNEKGRDALEQALLIDEYQFYADFQNYDYGGENFRERLEDERRIVLSKLGDQPEGVTPYDVVSAIRDAEMDIDMIFERIVESKARPETAYGSTFYSGWETLTKDRNLSAAATGRDKMVVVGSSLGLQCALGHIELGYSKCVGYELLPSQVRIAREIASSFDLTENVEFKEQNALESDLEGAGLIWMNSYAWKDDETRDMYEKVVNEADADTLVVSYEDADDYVRVSDANDENGLKLMGSYEIATSWNPRLTGYIYKVVKKAES